MIRSAGLLRHLLLAKRYAKADSDVPDATVDARGNPEATARRTPAAGGCHQPQCGAGDGRRTGTDALVRPPVVFGHQVACQRDIKDTNAATLHSCCTCKVPFKT